MILLITVEQNGLKESFKTVCAGCSRDGYVKAVNRSWTISGERVLRHIVIFKDLV